MKLTKILTLLILLIILCPARSFADRPEITAGQSYFDIFRGYYVLKDNVHVVMNNHGFEATISADEAKVNVVTQKCWATGKVKFTHGAETFACNSAYLQWKTRTAEVVGGVKFNSPKNLKVTADSAIFNWQTKIVDFYGRVNVTPFSNLHMSGGLKLSNKLYSHVRYDVLENTILQIEENSVTPQIVIPDPDDDSEG